MKRYIYKLKQIRPNWTLLILFLVFFFFLRWNSFEMPFERDEGDYSYSAWIMRKGLMPYENSIVQKPPLIVYTYLLSQMIFGDNLWGPRLIAAIFTLVTSYLLFKIVSKDYGKKAGWITVFVFTPIVISPINSGLAANTEIFMLLPFLGFLYVMTKYGLSNNNLKWAISGILASLAISYKPICLYAIGFVYVVFMFTRLKGSEKLGNVFLNMGAAILGGVLTFLFALLPFLINDGGRGFWEQAVVFNAHYAKFWGYGIDKIVYNLSVMSKSFWIIYLLFVFYILIKPPKWKFYFGVLFFSLLGAYQTYIRHYLIIIMPFLALMSGVVISKAENIKAIGKNQIYLVLIVIALIIWPVKAQFSQSPQNLSLWIYGNGAPFFESKLVSEKLESVTSVNDCVFIAGSEAQILYYAKRLSCTKYMSTYIFTMNTPLQKQHQENVIIDLKNNIPKAIIYSNKSDSSPLDSGSSKLVFDYVTNLLNSNYQLHGGWVWGIKGGTWSENLSEDEVKKASLLLYTLKI